MRKVAITTFILVLVAHALMAMPVRVGAEQMSEYLPLLSSKRVGLVANHTSLVGQAHLLDTLRARGVNVLRVFAPEHGFRGTAEAGEIVASSMDKKSGVEIASIYGRSKKPSAEQLRGVQVMVFDMQDVGTRFYTYLSTMHYVMEACAENGIPLIVLDRPNPNGSYVDGPILQPQYRSFIGMHPIPIVHGMTLGELAQMINGEAWLKNSVQCELTVITCENYNHATPYNLPVKPSPNLPDMRSIYLYPSMCLFEGTIMSIGRGTATPFQMYGHPAWAEKTFTFTPRGIRGVALHPPHENKRCYGVDLRSLSEQELFEVQKINLDYLIEAYRFFAKKEKFFTNFFSRLAGTDVLQKQIEQGWSVEKIRASWQPELEKFKQQREKYLLYHAPPTP